MLCYTKNNFQIRYFPLSYQTTGRESSCLSDTAHAFTQLENYSPKQMTRYGHVDESGFSSLFGGFILFCIACNKWIGSLTWIHLHRKSDALLEHKHLTILQYRTIFSFMIINYCIKWHHISILGIKNIKSWVQVVIKIVLN